MYRRVMLTGVTAAVIVGAGGTALALTGSDTTAGAPTSTSSQHAANGKTGKTAKGKGKLLRRLQHAQIVTHGKNGFITHDLIKGTVTAVSPTSITVQASDKKSETFVVDKDTKVRVRTAGKGAAATIAGVAKGDHVAVAGTGATTYTAKHVVDVKK